MYKLKNVHENVLRLDHDENIYDKQLSDEDLEALLNKQTKVLNILEQLQLRVNKLIPPKPKNIETSVPAAPKKFVPPQRRPPKTYEKKSESEINTGIANLTNGDIVVFANPENPPYSLLAVPILWPSVSWDISYHVHSSVTKDLKTSEKFNAFKNVSLKNNKNIVKVFVIWQQTEQPSLKIIKSPTETLHGEVSLLRLFDQCLATEKVIPADQVEFDKVLNLIDDISRSTSGRTSELYNLVNISDTKLDIENVILWSLLYRKNRNAPKIEKWLEILRKIIVS